jgi:hypothetical protein
MAPKAESSKNATPKRRNVIRLYIEYSIYYGVEFYLKLWVRKNTVPKPKLFHIVKVYLKIERFFGTNYFILQFWNPILSYLL